MIINVSNIYIILSYSYKILVYILQNQINLETWILQL